MKSTFVIRSCAIFIVSTLLLWMTAANAAHPPIIAGYWVVTANQTLGGHAISQAPSPAVCKLILGSIFGDPIQGTYCPAISGRLSSGLPFPPLPGLGSQLLHKMVERHSITFETFSSKGKSVSMKSDILGQWVELREESSPGTIVLKRATSDIPPARGRRSLHFLAGGKSMAKEPGADDRGVLQGGGHWRLEGGTLSIDMPGWTGHYRPRQPDHDTLVLTID
jgi:hypothetical protein